MLDPEVFTGFEACLFALKCLSSPAPWAIRPFHDVCTVVFRYYLGAARCLMNRDGAAQFCYVCTVTEEPS